MLHFSSNNKLQTKKLVITMLILSFATLVRSTGNVSAIIPMYFTLHKLVRNWCDLEKPGARKKKSCYGRYQFFCKGNKYLFILLICPFVVAIVPTLIVTIWKPYEMYCLSRLDTDKPVPNWCFDSFPNVYKYI